MSLKLSLILLVASLLAAGAADEWPTHVMISSLDGHCIGSICDGFNFTSAHQLPYFDLKLQVDINDEYQTYDLKPTPNYDSLTFVNSTFALFPVNLFQTLPLKELDIRNCSIEEIVDGSFSKASKLQILLLSDNRLRSIYDGIFYEAGNLQYLFLDYNDISVLTDLSFVGLDQLQYLELSHNRLESLPPAVFAGLRSLRELHLNHNRLRTIENGLLANNPRLHSITFTDNLLSDVEEEAFKTQENLILLALSNNEPLATLVISFNVGRMMAANCSLSRVNVYGKAVDVDLADNRILELYFSQPEHLETLNLHNNALQQIASLSRATKLRWLDLGDNPDMGDMPDPWLGGALEHLDLGNTSLRHLPIATLAAQPNLRYLNVSYNKLREINPQNFVHLEHLTHFYIAGNDWNCFNLNLMMDVLIKPRAMTYRTDNFDMEFPGEYVNGIACMYRIDDDSREDDDDITKPQSIVTMESHNDNDNRNDRGGKMEDENYNARDEIDRLRRELKAIVTFYEEKFKNVYASLDNVNNRLAKFEALNQTMWDQVTIMV